MTASDNEPFEVFVFDGDGSGALIDINDNQALQALMDEEEFGSSEAQD